MALVPYTICGVQKGEGEGGGFQHPLYLLCRLASNEKLVLKHNYGWGGGGHPIKAVKEADPGCPQVSARNSTYLTPLKARITAPEYWHIQNSDIG